MASAVVKNYSKITHNTVSLNGEKVFSGQGLFDEFSEAVYRHFKISYPKFFKMDNLSKLGFLASELVLNEESKPQDPYKHGMIFSNKSSSLDTDVKYNRMMKKGIANPAVFVYSLPNIVIGEISIRNGFKGESTFFISDQYDIPFQVNYVNSLLNNGVLDYCLCGWVELMKENYEAFLYLATTKGDSGLLPHTIENVEALYQK